MQNYPHVSADKLEKYALARGSGTGFAKVEEHLLICSACQERLSGIDEFIAVLKTALAVDFEPVFAVVASNGRKMSNAETCGDLACQTT